MIIDQKNNSFKDLFLDVATYGYKGEQIDDDMQWYLILLLNLRHILAKQFRKVARGVQQSRETQYRLLLLFPPQHI